MPALTRLGTENWRSYAHFRAGVGWALDGEVAEARRQFALALAEDPDNRGARVNLVALDIAATDLTTARPTLEPMRTLLPHNDVVWYTAAYHLATAYLYLARTSDNESSALLDLATRCAIEVEGEASRLISDFEKRKQSGQSRAEKSTRQPPSARSVMGFDSVEEERRVAEFARDAKAAAVSLNACILLLTPAQVQPASVELKKLDARDRELSQVRYNLARFSAIVATNSDFRDEDPEVDNSMKHLDAAVSMDQLFAYYAQHDPLLDQVRTWRSYEFATILAKSSTSKVSGE